MIAALILAVAAQDAAPLDAHLRNVHLERRLAFLAAWDESDEARRDIAIEAFRSRRSQSLPAVYQCSAQWWSEQERVLRTEVAGSHELSWEDRFALSLDLAVMPGAFQAGDAGRGDEVVVRVLPAMTRLFHPFPEVMQLRLVWEGPAGERIPARQEPIGPGAWRLPGFEMYLRAPASRPGLWHLRPEVELDGVTGRGFPVPVPCVKSLSTRAKAAQSEEAPSPARIEALNALEWRLQSGWRNAQMPTVEEILDGASAPLPVPLERWPDETSIRRLNVSIEQAAELLVVMVPVIEEPGWPLAAGTREGWTKFAQDRSCEVIFAACAVKRPVGVDLIELLAGLREDYPSLPITLVVHGADEGNLIVAGANRMDPVPFDRLVIDTVPGETAKPRQFFDVPTLLITPLFEAAPVEQLSDTFARKRTPLPPVLAERHFPVWIHDWLEGL